MNKRSVVYSGLLLFALVIVAVLSNRGIIMGVTTAGDITLTVDRGVSGQYLVSDTSAEQVEFTGTISFAENEVAIIRQVVLREESGPQKLELNLPVASTNGQFVSLTSNVGTASVKVTFTDLVSTSTGATIPSTTLGSTLATPLGSTVPGTVPGTTLPTGSSGLKGTSSGAKIVYVIRWTPPAGSGTVGIYQTRLHVDLGLTDGRIFSSSPALYSFVAPTATPTSTPVPTSTPAPPVPTATPTGTPPPTPTPTNTPLPTATPTVTPTPVPAIPTPSGTDPTPTAEEIKTTLEGQTGAALAETIAGSDESIRDDITAAILGETSEDADTTRIAEAIEEISDRKLLDDQEIGDIINTGTEDGTLDTSDVAKIIANDKLSTTTVGTLVETVDTGTVADALAEDTEVLDKVAEAVAGGGVTTEKATEVIEEADDSAATDLITSVADKNKEEAGKVIDGTSAEKVDAIAQSASTDPAKAKSVATALSEAQPEKTEALPIATLVTLVASADINFDTVIPASTPSVSGDCAESLATQVAAGTFVYTIGQTVADWCKTVGSPAPISSILGKFTRELQDVQFVVTDRFFLPQGAPAFTGKTLFESFDVDVVGTQEGDLAAAHLELFVTKSWIEANDIHKWSVEFHRFDEAESRWVPIAARRVREDEEKVYYSGVVPGFSTIAITGDTEPPANVIQLSNLTVSPALAAEGDPVTIGVTVTNESDVVTDYVTNLFLNSVPEAVEQLSLPANGSTDVSFTVNVDAGSYEIRIGDQFGSFQVTEPDTPTPTPAPVEPDTPTPVTFPPTVTPVSPPTGDSTATGGLLLAMGLAGALALLLGMAVVRSHRKEEVTG